VRAPLRAQSEAHPRCPTCHAKSGKQVRSLISLQASPVVGYESCESGEQEVRGDARAETRFRFRTDFTSVVQWLVVSRKQ
jgi:hypothetical protein